MNYKLFITDSAKADIKGALSYIKDSLLNPKAANELAEFITNEINSLKKFPFSGTPVQDKILSDYGFRFLLVKNYKAYYIADKNKKLVTVIRFLYVSRDYESILKEDTFALHLD